MVYHASFALTTIVLALLSTVIAVTYDDSGAQRPLHYDSTLSRHQFQRHDTISHLASLSKVKDVVITPDLSDWIREWMKNGTVPGLALGVVHLDGETEFGGFGNRTEDGDPVTESTLFDLASCSKAFLTTSLGILINDYATATNSTPLPSYVETATGGVFDWDSKVKDLLPEGEWGLEDQWASEKANLRDLLGHMTGMPRHDFAYAPGDSGKDIVAKLKQQRPAYELRQKYHYNNQMYMVGARILATLTGNPYTSFVQSRIFDPLNMSSSTYSPAAASASIDQAGKSELSETWTTFGRRIPFWFREEDVQLNAGYAGVISSVQDLERYVRTLLNYGVSPVDNRTIIPRSVFDEITTAHAITNGSPKSSDISIGGYGLGWERASYLGKDYLAHSGAIPGFSLRILFLPNDGLGFIILVNAGDKFAENTVLERKLMRAAFDLSDPAGPTDPEKPKKNETETTPLPLPLSAYAGTYNNSGYGGSLTLCDPSPSALNAHAPEYCARVIAEYASVDAFLPRASSDVSTDRAPQLLASWPRIWSSHLRLTHKTGNIFWLSPSSLFVEGYGRNATPFDTWDWEGDGPGEAVMEFDVTLGDGVRGTEEETGNVLGMGLRSTLDNEGVSNREKKWAGKEEITVWDVADAWWDRVI